MFTIVSCPKPFQGHIGAIQRNAIESWKKLVPSCEIFLCGDDKGVSETCSDLGLQHLADVRKTEYRTPLLSDIFMQSQKRARFQNMLYINADIILFQDFIPSLKTIFLNKFLLVGQRTNLQVTEKIQFTPNWARALFQRAHHEGQLQGPSAMDYFYFKKGMFGKIPDFAVGRVGFDNWLIYRARCLGIPVIDATGTVLAVHQNHDHSHVFVDSSLRSQRIEEVWNQGPENIKNLDLAGRQNIFTLQDANWLLTPKGPHRIGLSRLRYRRQLEVVGIIRPWLKPSVNILLKNLPRLRFIANLVGRPPVA